MGLLEEEIKEIREINQQIADGKIPHDQIQDRLAPYSVTSKKIDLMFRGYALMAKYGKKMEMRIIDSNVIGDHAATISLLSNPEEEKLRCPEKDRLISRADCLDFSGSNSEICHNCQHFVKTRRLLLGHKQ